MESIEAGELHVDKSKVYGRSFKTDMDSFYNDISLRNTLAVFGKYTFIKSVKHLSDIVQISLEEASDRLECLHNLNLVKLSDSGYELVSDELYSQSQKPSEEVRRRSQAEKLVQLAGKYTDCNKFSDGFAVFCTTEAKAKELEKRLFSVLKEFAIENQSLDDKEKDSILNVGLGLTTNLLKNPEGGN
jgi:hypothetical protein